MKAAVFLLCLGHLPAALADLRFHWEDHFSREDKSKLMSWVSEVHAGVEALVGELPFDVQIYFHRTRAGEPVPWANTERRSYRQGVHFHVDPRFSLKDLREDWTAAHELSHLVFPYLGRSHSWFAEGFASFMQYQVMHDMGIISRQEMLQRYGQKLDRARRSYSHQDRPFAEAAPRLRAERKYPTMYWGGAAYFLQVNQALQRQNKIHMVDVLRQYVACCRRGGGDLEQLIRDLDRVARTTVFSRHLERFRTEAGFPRYQDTLAAAPRKR